MSDYSSLSRDEPPVAPDLFSAPAAATPTAPAGVAFKSAPVATAPAARGVRAVEAGASPAALLAAAGAAVVGGLAWAGVVIATHYDIGILAWLVGAATGAVLVRVAGGPVGTLARIVAGALAAGGIMVGKYVIFVHAVRVSIGALLASNGVSVGYLDTNTMSVFLHNFGTVVRPIYALWVALAFVAAVRVASGRGLLARR